MNTDVPLLKPIKQGKVIFVAKIICSIDQFEQNCTVDTIFL